ncbi:hypothetical protein [Flavobacterium fluviatile]|uniref:hypothetical protein n=1 Tax=Flavobacterium fluviatile TaxID=1862387 RepID=UPI0013D3F0EB|nr:hypothetical protein [Flavobacterium fluviatile]
MAIKLKLKEVLETELYYGFYEIFVLGGFDVRANPDFFVEILDLKTNESILLREKNLKARDYKNGIKAVKFFSFEIYKYTKCRISVHNFEDMVVNDLMPMPITNPISDFLFNFFSARKQEKINLDQVEILIC